MLMKRTLPTIVLALLCTAATASALPLRPKKVRDRIQDTQVMQIYTAYADSLSALATRYRSWTYGGSDLLSNPYYFPLFAAPTFYVAPINQGIGTLAPEAAGDTLQDRLPALGTDNTLALNTAINTAWRDVYSSLPEVVQYTERQMDTAVPDARPIDKKFRPEVNLSDKARPLESKRVADDVDDDWKIIVRRPNFWTFKTNVSLQLMQNYISSNWYKGGESSNSWLAQVNVEATYNNKQKVIFNNYLDTKLGFISSRNDEEHKFRTNADQLRLTNKLGLRATKHWYYTFMLQSWTQFYRGFKSNDTYVYSDFMSPFETIFSIGMDYQLSVKNFNISATVSPFACDLKYVDRKYLATSFGIKEGKRSDFSFGSNITVKYNWNICKNVSWNGRIYYYTNYDKAQLEWENTFNLTINKYLATKLFLYPRFDDSVNRKEGASYIQFNELLSFGLNVTF